MSEGRRARQGAKKPFFVLKELNILSSTPLGSKRNISIHNHLDEALDKDQKVEEKWGGRRRAGEESFEGRRREPVKHVSIFAAKSIWT